jgi:hypothetical protein
MSGASNWRDVKAKAREIDPSWDTPERRARRAAMREQMLASMYKVEPCRRRARPSAASGGESAGLVERVQYQDRPVRHESPAGTPVTYCWPS